MRWYAALATLIVFLLLAWLLGAVLPLTPGERTVLQVALVALALVAAAALLWYLRPDAPVAVAGPTKDDALVNVGAARARLPRGGFDERPLILLVGTEGSCKTTVVTRAGMDAELLAGDGAGDTPPATAAANLWLAGGAVFAEPGGKVLADEGRWRGVVRALRAPALAAAVGRAEPAPRAAVVCVGCDLFFGDQGQRLEQTAQLLRARLTDAAREFGVALPVYVLFTKADRVPHFEAWAAPLTPAEVREPLGAALPFDAEAGSARGAGSYASGWCRASSARSPSCRRRSRRAARSSWRARAWRSAGWRRTSCRASWGSSRRRPPSSWSSCAARRSWARARGCAASTSWARARCW
jgi:type VI secretion system protein ImpL